jgi:hypothetical protein
LCVFSTATSRVRAMCIDVRSRMSARHVVAVVAPGLRAYRSRDEALSGRRAALLRKKDVRVLLGEQLVARLGRGSGTRSGSPCSPSVGRPPRPDRGAPPRAARARARSGPRAFCSSPTSASPSPRASRRRLRRRYRSEDRSRAESTALTICNRFVTLSRVARRRCALRITRATTRSPREVWTRLGRPRPLARPPPGVTVRTPSRSGRLELDWRPGGEPPSEVTVELRAEGGTDGRRASSTRRSRRRSGCATSPPGRARSIGSRRPR